MQQDDGGMPEATSGRTISTRFGLIFWGLLLVFVDINVFDMDILPDFVGYILIAVGCSGLASGSRRFSTASVLSWVLTGVALVSLLNQMMPHMIVIALDCLSLGIECAMMWFLLGGVMEMAAARQRPQLAEYASQCRIAYVVLRCVGALAGLVGVPGVFTVLVAVVCFVVLLILILHLLYRAKQELAGGVAV